MGPILIFDKSALQSLNSDEALWLDNFFFTNITPLFFIETLADLKLKEHGKARFTPEQVVRSLADKTPVLSSKPSVHHGRLCVAELVDRQEVPMQYRQIIVSGGIPLVTADRNGIWYKPSPEEEAFERWKRHEFLEVERQMARAWRLQLSNLDLDTTYRSFQQLFVGRQKPKSLADAKKLVDEIMIDPTQSSWVFRSVLASLRPAESHQKVLQRWNAEGRPLLRTFAPYTSHVFSVDLFFNISVAADLISRDRPSNKIDLAYLYYLPFCMVFTSGDHLHAKVAPLFLEDNQSFVWAPDLKEGLRHLDQHYSGLPENVKVQGIMKFASRPPADASFLVSRLWDKHMSKRWRNLAADGMGGFSQQTLDQLSKEIEKFEANARIAHGSIHFDSDRADNLVIERHVPVMRGKWRVFSADVEKALDDGPKQ